MQYTSQLDEIEARFQALTDQMADPAVISDSATYRKVAKQQSEYSVIVEKYREWKRLNRNLQEVASDARRRGSGTAPDGGR